MRGWSEFTTREKILLILLPIIGASLAFYFFLYQPKSENVSNINQELDQTIYDIRSNQDVLRRKEELKQEYKAALAKLKKDDQDKPIAISQKSSLIVRINEIIDITGVNLKTMESNKNKESESDKYAYTQMPIKIRISGDYGNILNFVNRIEELKYLIKIDTINLNSNLEAGLNSKSKAKINAQINLVAFATADVQGR